MFEVGIRLPMREVICNDPNICEQMNPKMIPGKVYEVALEIEPRTPFTPADTPTKIYEAIKAVRKQYPGVAINYIGITDDGKHVIIQMYDTPGWQLIAVLILILSILIVSYIIVSMVIKTVSQGPTPESPWYWVLIATAITLPAVGIGYLVKQLRKRLI